jgi:elongation factor P
MRECRARLLMIFDQRGKAVISASEFKKGSKILFKDEPYVVLEYHHVKPGKGGAFMRTKMKNLITGLVHEETFRSEEKLRVPDLEYCEMLYLYFQDNLYQFMNQETYEQVALDKNQLSEVLNVLKEQTVYTILYFSGNPIAVNPPLFMELKVAHTLPGVRGDTAQGSVTKPATLETGLVVQVPLFVNEGDIVKIDTRDESYIERVNKK